MDHVFIKAPSQTKLINDVVFDVTGWPVTSGELIVLGTVLVTLKMVFSSPLFGRV